MARYLLTGGAGFIGGRIAERLCHQGHDIVVLDDLSTSGDVALPAAATLIEADLASEGTYDRLPEGPFDAALHLGAQSSGEVSHSDPLRDFDVNARGSLLLLRWCQATGVRRLLYASSMAVYGSVEGLIDETVPLSPRSYYGMSKAAAEAAVRFFDGRGLRTTIFRMFNVYGPGQDLANLRQGIRARVSRNRPFVLSGVWPISLAPALH